MQPAIPRPLDILAQFPGVAHNTLLCSLQFPGVALESKVAHSQNTASLQEGHNLCSMCMFAPHKPNHPDLIARKFPKTVLLCHGGK